MLRLDCSQNCVLQNYADVGLFVTAGRGTIFLDEIAELPLHLQVRLLRALQEKEVRPVGATQGIPVTARILAATNRDLVSMVQTGEFRKDLYYRLHVVEINVPPLRERREDIPVLVANLLRRKYTEEGIVYSLSEEAAHLLIEYDWPGNIRELEHAMERACALADSPLLQQRDFESLLHSGPKQGTFSSEHSHGNPFEIMPIAELERRAIYGALQRTSGDRVKAAEILGIGKTTLYRRLRNYGAV